MKVTNLKSLPSTVLSLTLCMGFATISTTASAQTTQNEKAPYLQVEVEDGPPIGLMLTDDLEETIKRDKANHTKFGYIEKLDQVPRAEYVQQRMAERVAAAKFSGQSHSPQNLGFYNMAGLNHSTLPFQPTLLAKHYLLNNTQSYLLLGGHMLKQLYTKTVFGTLIIDEMPNAFMTLGQANIEIDGKAATFSHIKHKGEKWATVVYVPTEDGAFVVETDRKLVGKKKQQFIEMIEELVRKR